MKLPLLINSTDAVRQATASVLVQTAFLKRQWMIANLRGLFVVMRAIVASKVNQAIND
jgi:hypothetical protein